MIPKKLARALLFPHAAVMIILTPVSAVLLIGSMVFLGTASPVSIISYVLSAYTLALWCLRIPRLIAFFKTFGRENKFLLLWRSNTRLRMIVTLYGSLIWNTAYAAFQLGMGFWHRSFWFFSLAGYYIALAVMRLFLVRHTGRHRAGERMREELVRYRACGIVFLIMNLALALIIFFMVYWNRTFDHHEITAIAMAAYTFTSLTMAIVNVFKYRKYNSPVYSASKAISLAAACVSMLTLESTMLTTFGADSMTLAARRILLGTSGGAISAFIIVMAVYMIVHATKKIRLLGAVRKHINGK